MAIYALIDHQRVTELFETDGDITQMFHPSFIWVNVDGIEGIAEGWVATQDEAGWSFTPYVEPPPTAVEILASQSAKLQQLTQIAAAQKAALINRISTLNDAIDLDMATPAEAAELPVRTVQLKAIKAYAVLLGRVTSQSGWPSKADWPAQPTEGMDLTVSAITP